jgi:hypothetical protein
MLKLFTPTRIGCQEGVARATGMGPSALGYAVRRAEALQETMGYQMIEWLTHVPDFRQKESRQQLVKT